MMVWYQVSAPQGHRNALALQSPEALPDLVREHAKAGDMVVCLGAGNITQWANSLKSDLEGGNA